MGAHPILLSLTPRNAWDTKRPGHIARVDGTFGLWARQVAEEQGIPFVDLNEISASKYDRFSAWKVDYYFYRDRIHTSAFGARLNARSAAEGLAASPHPALKALQACLTNLEPPAAQVKREKGKPVVFITGDSTVKNEDKDPNGMWGWGSQAGTIFDTDKITVANEAKAGRSTRTYLEENRWERVYNALQPGDFVLIQFGHNDIGDIDRGKWYREVVAETAVEFVDLHNISADALDRIGQEGAKAYYNRDHTHTSLKGAQLNAQSIAEGLRTIDSPLARYLK